MKKAVIGILFVCSAFIAKAQDYQWAVGLRAGYGSGLTVKKVLSSDASLEGILDFRYHGFNVTGLYEVNKYDAFDVDRLNWYFGGGAHFGSYTGLVTDANGKSTSVAIIGLDGIIGIEYNIVEAPINISLDWKPAMNLGKYNGFWGDNGALSIRYYF